MAWPPSHALPGPLERGGLTFVQNPSNCLESKHPKCFTLPQESCTNQRGSGGQYPSDRRMYRTARPAQCVRVIKERSNHITVAATLFYILNEIALNNPLRDNLTNARQVGQILVILSHKGATHKMIRILLSRKLGEIRWTQAELARVTGIRPTTINELYHELAKRVNLEHLDLICEALQAASYVMSPCPGMAFWIYSVRTSLDLGVPCTSCLFHSSKLISAGTLPVVPSGLLAHRSPSFSISSKQGQVQHQGWNGGAVSPSW